MYSINYILQENFGLLNEADKLLYEMGLMENKNSKAKKLVKIYKNIVYKGVVPLTALILANTYMNKGIEVDQIQPETLENHVEQVESLPQEKLEKKKENIQQEILNVSDDDSSSFDDIETADDEGDDSVEEESSFLTNLIKDLKKHEGVRPMVYRDSEGNRTVGVGFNLERSDASRILNSIGSNYNKILSGQESLSDQQMQELLQINIQESIQSAKRIFDNYDSFPPEVKSIAINLIFNMGEEGVRGFPNFIRAMNSHDWDEAAEQLMYRVSEKHGVYSDWWRQVTNNHGNLEQVRRVNPHNRGVEIISTLRNL